MSLIDFLWLLPGFVFVQVIKQSNTQDRVQSETRYILTLLGGRNINNIGHPTQTELIRNSQLTRLKKFQTPFFGRG